MNKNDVNAKNLLDKPVAMMTGNELVALIADTVKSVLPDSSPKSSIPQIVYGLQGIADVLGCSVPKVNRIKRTGILKDAIIQNGRTIIMDVPKAFELLKAVGDVDKYLEYSKDDDNER